MTETVRDLYLKTCQRLLEDGGLQTGVFTEDAFLKYFADVILDFAARTGLSKAIFTQTIQAGVAQYKVPDRLLRVEHAFFDGRLLNRTTLANLDTSRFDWRKKRDTPKQWHEDGLPIKTVELFPTPDRTGKAYVLLTPENIAGKYGDFFVGDRNLTFVGSERPVQTTYQFTDPIPLVPDSAVPYLGWGVLNKVFSEDSENKDEQRAAYSNARFFEGVGLFRSVIVEALLEDYDEVAVV